MNRLASVLLAVAALVAALHADARACSLATPTVHVVDTSMQATDHTAPTLPGLAPRIARGHGPQQDGCATSAMSCDDIGTITFRADAADDTTPRERIGYRFSLAAGALPEGLSLPSDAVEPFSDGLHLSWIDGATRSGRHRLHADDRRRRSRRQRERPRTVHVVDDRSHACAIAGGPDTRKAFFWIAFGALLAMGRRRRRA